MFKQTAQHVFSFGAAARRAVAGYAPAPMAEGDRLNRAIAERIERRARQEQASSQSRQAAGPYAAPAVAAHVGEG